MIDNAPSPETPEVTETPANTEAYLKIIFPRGSHTTEIQLQMAYIDAVQMEIAGRFLIRQSEKIQQAAEATQQQRIVIPQPGLKV